jgi:hypothetical protein
MKIIALISLTVICGCILTCGCIGQVKNTTQNTTTLTPANTFVPFSNETSNVTNVTVSSGLNGSLVVSIGGWEADLPVSIDNASAGIVRRDKPLNLMLEEGNHTVKVCAGTICEEEVVTIKFAKQGYVNFEDRLIKDVEFPKPTARIVGFNPSGSSVTVNVEFINPSPKDLSMSANIKCAYTYIDSRSNNREGGSAESIINADVGSGQRTIQTVYLYLADGYSYTYSTPVISGITSK